MASINEDIKSEALRRATEVLDHAYAQYADERRKIHVYIAAALLRERADEWDVDFAFRTERQAELRRLADEIEEEKG